jgi:hypothetical protein
MKLVTIEQSGDVERVQNEIYIYIQFWLGNLRGRGHVGNTNVEIVYLEEVQTWMSCVTE